MPASRSQTQMVQQKIEFQVKPSVRPLQLEKLLNGKIKDGWQMNHLVYNADKDMFHVVFIRVSVKAPSPSGIIVPQVGPS